MEKIHWIGLESYSEENAYLFFGRNAEIEELSNSIFHNNQTVIYGPSGVGKSSIIKAGVIRIARNNVFLPVYVRLSFNEDSDCSYVNQIITAVKEEAKKNDVDIEHIIDYVNPNRLSLWEFFHCNRFVNIYDLPVIPLIIIDQFEEIFTLSKDKTETDRFFKNVSELCDNITPDYIKTYLSESNKYVKYPDSIDTRLVFSLREDFLPRLEEQAAKIPALKRNRFSLQSINGKQAMEIITSPEPGLVSEDVAISIIRTVTGNANVTKSKLTEVEVEPSLLSLFCSELDNKRVNKGEKVISQELVDEAGKNIINDFYKDKISHISPNAIEFLEKKLLTKNGYRNSAPLEDTLDSKELTQEEYEFLSKNRILRTEERNGVKRIEFTHDILCKAACDYRDHKIAILKQQEEMKRQEEEHQKQIALQEQEKQELIKQQEEELAKLDAKRKAAKKGLIRTVLISVVAAVMAIIIIVFLVKKIGNEREKFRNQIGKFNVTISLSEDAAVKSLWWEATLKVKCWTGTKDTILLDTLINKMLVDSTFAIPVDSTGYTKFRINVEYPESSRFYRVTLEKAVESLIYDPAITIPIRLRDPINYGGQLVLRDKRNHCEYYIKNALVVFNNEVDFTDNQGRFLFHLQDTVKPGDQMMIVKKGYKAITNIDKDSLKTFRLISDYAKFKEIVLLLSDSDNYLNRKSQCDSISAMLDSINRKQREIGWTYYREQPIKYIGSKGDDVNDLIYLYIKTIGANKITGFYFYMNDKSKKKRYRYYIFNGVIGKTERDPKDALNYRTFELTSHDIANNEESIKGRLGVSASNKSCEFKIFMYSRQIAESIMNKKEK